MTNQANLPPSNELARELNGPLAPFGPGDEVDAAWSQGYRLLEITERENRYKTAEDFPEQLRLYLRLLKVAFHIFDFCSRHDYGEDPNYWLDALVRDLRFRLYALAVSAMKSAFDSVLGGYYAQTWNHIRFQSECCIQMLNARLRPETVERWYATMGEDAKDPSEHRISNVVTYFDSHPEELRTDEDGLNDYLVYERVNELRKRGNDGAHPTSAFLWQTLGEEQWTFALGSVYRSRAAGAALIFGIEGMVQTLVELIRTEPIPQELLIEIAGIVDENDRLQALYRGAAAVDADMVGNVDV